MSTATDTDAIISRIEEHGEEIRAQFGVRELPAARVSAGLTQEQVAASMGTTKSAVSRLEGAATHSPSVSTLKKYAKAVGCDVEIRLVPAAGEARATGQ